MTSMSMHKSQQQYEQSLQEALDRYRHLTTINEWTLQKTEKKHLQHGTSVAIQLWKYKDAYKVTLKNDSLATHPSWSLNDWRSLLETDGAPGLNQMVEKRQVIARVDKHTRVSRIKMKDGWTLGSSERIVIEQIIQHSTSLRYVTTSSQKDNLTQLTCLDVQYPTNQPGQQFEVTFYCEWTTDRLSSATIPSEQLSAHAMSMMTDFLTSLSLYTPIPFISHQDSEIQLDYNTYDPFTRTLDIKYHFGTNDEGIQDSTSPTASDTIKIHRHLPPHIPLQSRSWDPPYEPVLPSSLRKHDFMSSSLVFRPSSPGSAVRRVPPIDMAKKLSTADLSSPYSTNALRQDLPSTIPKGEQLIIDIDGDNKNNTGDTIIAHLTLQLRDSDNDLGPFLTNQFAQLCLRCIKYYPYDMGSTASRHSLILHHPESLLADLKLPQNITQLFVRLTLVLEFGTSAESNKNNVTATSDMRLIMNRKQWPVRNTTPWDVAIDESDQDDDDDDLGYDNQGKDLDDDLDGDPFMESMEDVHEVNSDREQLDPRHSSQNLTSVKSSQAVESTTTDTSAFSLATKPHPSNLKSTLPFNDRSHQPEPSKLEQSHTSPAPDNSQPEEKSSKQQIQRKSDTKQVEKDDTTRSAGVKQRRPPSSGKKINIPHVDPPEMLKAYQYFDALLHSNDWHITQKPDLDNGFATIMKMDVEGHPTGVLLCETVWKHCSIWDAKAVLSCSEAREIWDSMFEKGEYICSVTPSCAIWHSKLKSAWPASPRDYVAFTAQYTSSQRVDICSTSCIGNTYEHYHLPKETSDFVRATLDLSGWRLDRLDSDGSNNNNHNSSRSSLSSPIIDEEKQQSNSISVRYVLQTHFQGWIPWFLLNQLTTQAPNVPTSAYQYLERYGAPPCVEELIMATIQQHRYDHAKKNWRLEYTRSITTGEQGPTTVTIRLDRRRWAFHSSSDGSHYNITVDPPPSKVVAEARKEDPYGVWLIIEHDESFIIPRRGKILVLIKPGKYQQHQALQKKKKHSPINLMINGTMAPIHNDAAITPVGPLDTLELNEQETGQSGKSITHNGNPSTESAPAKISETVTTSPSISSTAPDTADDMTEHIRNLEVTPMEQAQAALLYLKKMDEQFGWTVVSDKQGLRINKRSGTKSSSVTAKSKPTSSTPGASTTPFETTSTSEHSGRSTSQLENHYLDVCDPCMIYKSSKVIENFSIDDVASVVTNVSDIRKAYDSSLEKCELVKPIQRGCQVIRQEIKGIFPFKSRELYMVSCTAMEKTVGASSSRRILYVESSIDIPVSKSSKLPRGKMFISGWILEPIDPYTTAANHPIPSIRATYVIALDLGPSVPSYLSNMSASGIVSKKIHNVELYLKQKGPLPYLVHPPPVVGFQKNKCSDIQALVDDEDNNGFLSSGHTSNTNKSNSSTSKNNTIKKDADKTVYPSTAAVTTTSASGTTSTKMTTLRWCDVQALYGQEPVLIVKSQCQYQQPPPPTTPRSALTPSFTSIPSPNQQQPSSSISIQPTASHSSSWMDRRRSSTSTTYSALSHRRGSLPPGSPTSSSVAAAAMVAATKQRKMELENSAHAATPTSTTTSMLVDPILCEVVVDLQMFSQGYDVIVNFRQHQVNDFTNNIQLCDENDLSGLLSVTVSELTPTPSHILLATMGGSAVPPGKHSVQVKLIASSLSQTTLFQPKDMDKFDLELILQHHQPVVTKIMKGGESTSLAKTGHDSNENERKDRLTMRDILGDDNDDDESAERKPGRDSANQWQGVVFVDGQMVSKYGEEVKIKSKRKTAPNQQSLTEGQDKKLVTFSPGFDMKDSSMDFKKGLNSKSTDDKAGLQQSQHEKLDVNKQSLDDHSSGLTSNSTSSSAVSEATTSVPYLGEGVMSAAIGGVNDIRTRLLLPFKNQSSTSLPITAAIPRTTTSSANTSDCGQVTNTQPQVIDKASDQINSGSISTEEVGSFGNRSHQINDLSYDQVTTTQQGTMLTLRMMISLGMIGLCMLCVIALLLIQPRPVVFESGQSIYSLCRIPWFGGWQIQLVASDSSAFTVS